MAQEIAPFWVIERFENGKSQGYWAGDSSRDFITEIDNAIQFCRKEDAWRIKRGWHWNDTQVTEHAYLERLAAPSVAGTPPVARCPKCDWSHLWICCAQCLHREWATEPIALSQAAMKLATETGLSYHSIRETLARLFPTQPLTGSPTWPLKDSAEIEGQKDFAGGYNKGIRDSIAAFEKWAAQPLRTPPAPDAELALSNHLCAEDAADWKSCADKHSECAVCHLTKIYVAIEEAKMHVCFDGNKYWLENNAPMHREGDGWEEIEPEHAGIDDTPKVGLESAAREIARELLAMMETCHICEGALILEEHPVHCENCSGDCENHAEPECTPIYVLHARLRKALELERHLHSAAQPGRGSIMFSDTEIRAAFIFDSGSSLGGWDRGRKHSLNEYGIDSKSVKVEKRRLTPVKTRICQCGATYYTYDTKKRWCSIRCYAHFRHRAIYKQKPQRVSKACARCKNVCMMDVRGQKFCSQRCATADEYYRNRDRHLARHANRSKRKFALVSEKP